METDRDVANLVEAIRKALPEAAKWTDGKMMALGFALNDNLYHLWIEALADVTNDAIRERREDILKEQTSFMAQQYQMGSEEVKKCIDVSYVENLMWELEARDKAWAWPLFPDDVRKLYVAMWGEPRF